jgi:hypothetical protein
MTLSTAMIPPVRMSAANLRQTSWANSLSERIALGHSRSPVLIAAPVRHDSRRNIATLRDCLFA